VRILILHSRYLSGPASGENRVVDDEARLLSEGGHDVKVWDPSLGEARRTDLVRAGVGAIWSRHATAKVSELLEEHRPEVVHCHNLFPTLSPAVLSTAADAGAAVVMTLHNYRLLCLPSTMLRDGRICEDCLGHFPWRGVVHRCYRDSVLGSASLAASISWHRATRTFDKVTLFAAISHFVRNKYIEAGFASNRISVKPHFAWPSPRRTGSGAYFLYLGRLSEEKGVMTLVKGWKPAFGRLLVVGEGPDEERLKEAAGPDIMFRATVQPSEVPALLQDARAVAIPSICYEGASRVVLEAYAAGVPVLASDIGGLPEVVGNDSGLLLSPANIEEWTDAMDQLANDSESQRLGDGAWHRWNTGYRPEHGLSNLEQVYRDALNPASVG
jgi:glycosyltransferase involved in cell wall biosynthesis